MTPLQIGCFGPLQMYVHIPVFFSLLQISVKSYYPHALRVESQRQERNVTCLILQAYLMKNNMNFQLCNSLLFFLPYSIKLVKVVPCWLKMFLFFSLASGSRLIKNYLYFKGVWGFLKYSTYQLTKEHY